MRRFARQFCPFLVSTNTCTSRSSGRPPARPPGYLGAAVPRDAGVPAAASHQRGGGEAPSRAAVSGGRVPARFPDKLGGPGGHPTRRRLAQQPSRMAPKAALAGTTSRRGGGYDPAAAHLGLLETEVVLRGGFLQQPVIIGGCKVSDGRVFLPLLKGDMRLSNFLTDEPSGTRPLSRSLVFETIQKLRPHRTDDRQRAFTDIHSPTHRTKQTRTRWQMKMDRNDFILSATNLAGHDPQEEDYAEELAGHEPQDDEVKRRRRRARLESSLPPWTEIVFQKPGHEDHRGEP